MESGEERRQRPTKAMNENPQTNITIKSLSTLEHFERCVILQIEVWGYSDGDVIPRRVFIVAQKIGGQVIGAFDGDTLVGFAMSLPGSIVCPAPKAWRPPERLCCPRRIPWLRNGCGTWRWWLGEQIRGRL